MIKRNRILYAILIITTIGLGLTSRADFIPKLIYPFFGDILYSLMIFFIIGFIFTDFNSLKIALISVGICYIIELSQFYEANWIVEIRNNKLGGLLLGYGFLWSDLISYLVGGALGFSIEFFILKKT
jgi:hypothetical protein